MIDLGQCWAQSLVESSHLGSLVEQVIVVVVVIFVVVVELVTTPLDCRGFHKLSSQ